MATPSGFPPLLKIGAFPKTVEARLRDTFELVDLHELGETTDQRARIQGIVTRSNYRITEDLLDRLPNLRIICTNGVGHDGIPLRYTNSRGIVVTNTPDVLNKAVAELAVGLVLAALRQIPQAYFGRQPQAVDWPYFNDLVALATHADILIVCCPGGQATYQIINAAVLNALGPTGILVNIARGSVVNQADLVNALANKTIRGAALDVFDEEPLADSLLRRLDNVVLTPHMGSATHETRMAMAELAIKNLRQFFATGQAATPVGQ